MASNTEITMEYLKQLSDVSEVLREALLHRNTDAIMAASSMQEGIVNKMNAMQRQPGNEAAAAAELKANPDRKKAISEIVGRIQRIQRTNKALASAFIDAFNRTFTYVSLEANRSPRTYGSTGSVRANVAPVLIEQKG